MVFFLNCILILLTVNYNIFINDILSWQQNISFFLNNWHFHFGKPISSRFSLLLILWVGLYDLLFKIMKKKEYFYFRQVESRHRPVHTSSLAYFRLLELSWLLNMFCFFFFFTKRVISFLMFHDIVALGYNFNTTRFRLGTKANRAIGLISQFHE